MKKENERRLNFLIDEALREEINDIAESEKNNIIFSEEFNNKMDKLFKQQRIKYMWLDNKKILGKVAVILIVCFVGISVCAVSVEAFRVKFFNYSINQNDKYTEINYNEKNRYISNEFELLYIPEGFSLSKEEISQFNIYLKFERGDNKYFCVSIENLEGKIQIDTEESNIKNKKIKDWEVMFINKDKENIAYWSDNNYAYSIYGNIEENDIVDIILNLKKIK